MELISKALFDLHDRGQKAPTVASVYVGLNNTGEAWGYLDRGTPFNREMAAISSRSDIAHCNKETFPLLASEYRVVGRSWGVTPGKGLHRELTALPEHILILPKIQE